MLPFTTFSPEKAVFFHDAPSPYDISINTISICITYNSRVCVTVLKSVW